MAENTGIEWTDHTFNPWWGCTEVSEGCDHCYARTWAKRFGVEWGVDAPRRTFGEAHWKEPLRWNREAEKAGKRARVFCASMADLFDRDAPAGALERLWALIRVTPWLDWQLLTKRPQEIARSLPADWGDGWSNVWLGTSVESEKYTWRIEKLMAVPGRSFVRFVSYEPALDLVDFFAWEGEPELAGAGLVVEGMRVKPSDVNGPAEYDYNVYPGLDWIIVGGESGPGARPFDLAWARAVVRQCRAAGVACFVKQLGARPMATGVGPRGPNYDDFLYLKDRKGGDMTEWPEDLRVREMPR